MLYAVVEVCDRELISIASAGDIDSALELANLLLDKHCEGIGCTMYKDDYGDMWQYARADEPNAWCNYRGQNWDAFIDELDV